MRWTRPASGAHRCPHGHWREPVRLAYSSRRAPVHAAAVGPTRLRRAVTAAIAAGLVVSVASLLLSLVLVPPPTAGPIPG
jgi:hypothetical protein